MSSHASLTKRLNLFMQGNRSVVDALLREVLPKLHEIAIRELKRERYMTPLSKTELIHGVWLSNLPKGGPAPPAPS